MSHKIDLGAIPTDVLADIRTRAEEEWPDDSEWQRDFIQDEARGYLAFHSADFLTALPVRDRIVSQAMEILQNWEERASNLQDEIDAYAEFLALAAEDIPSDELAAMKHFAASGDDWFIVQLGNLRSAINAYRYVRRTREEVGPIRDLLVRMEAIIGQECYNGNIQNYSSWGEWEGEGRSFRYPVTFIRNGAEEKRRARTSDLKPEELITGYYKFGANELSIFRALVRIIDMLEADFGFDKSRAGHVDSCSNP